ncbi:MAG: YkgJ family cysteine cluster protein [Gammaproteobacteria bacterium]|nr:YkgJ family cysteine cluster protein [Gammaproteobacteria bacterium]
MECRAGCAACCIAPSITSPIPGMPAGKPAGVACVQLDESGHCRLFGLPERPRICCEFQATRALCGENREQALIRIARLERDTA